MFYLYLGYGFVFLAAGLVLAFEARLPTGIMRKSVVWWLAVFCLAHGLAEWMSLAAHVDQGDELALASVAIALKVISFTCLARFGADVLAIGRRVARWGLALPAALALTWLVIATAVTAGRGFDLETMAFLDSTSRYVIALPGALLAAAGLVAASRDQSAAGEVRIARRLRGAGIAFVVYAALAGAVTPAAPFFPASEFNTEMFAAATHLPVEAFRALLAVVITWLVCDVYVIEAARAHAEWERKREEFIAIVAHDLRSPIGGIRMAAELLDPTTGGIQELTPERVKRLIRGITAGADSLERMVEDLLDAARIETHKLSLDQREIELRSLVTDVVERARHATAGHCVKTALPDVTMKVRADPTRIEQVLVNLLSNAAKYSAPESDIAVEATEHDDEVEIAVTNHGSGLTAQEAREVFSRFYRGKGHRERTEGLGLGLYIARGLVQAHGGRIWIDTKPGESATVHFTLPREARAA